MTGLGDRLKEARTAKGFTLDDLQSITKIQKRYLLGIESEDYSMMPGSFYVRAFIKQYAEAVGLNPDEMLDMYKDMTPTLTSEEEASQISTPTMTRKRGLKSNTQLNEMMPKLIVALFIIVIIVVFWFLYQYVASNKPKENGNVQQPITMEKKPEVGKVDVVDKEEPIEEPTTEEPPVEEPEKPTQSLSFKSGSGETSIYTLTDAETFQLEIRTNGGSWIGVKDNTGKEWMTPKADVMNAGETVAFDLTATSKVRIRVGRPTLTEIYVNGELLEYGVPAKDGVAQNINIEYSKENSHLPR
ncbi:helix-turn-helix domain-containing protein [Sporosarcina sp. NPDC096371]|uniref:helix-turn-helix domain-containing protein n=1 Tax=Sporosarcina sp. NPDC096371 TaxID=3364530 RepID=UPI0037F54DEA